MVLLQILARGPLSIAEYMRQVLLHPIHGYYVREGADVFGRKGDFVTSPELTELFGELIGIWMVATWQQLGSPPMVRLVEMGPGRGTLMRDALRAASKFPAFFNSLSVHLVEASPALRKRQAEELRCTAFPSDSESAAATPSVDGPGTAGSGALVESMQCGITVSSSTGPGPSITWHDLLADVPRDGTLLCVAHELFDALPVHQIEKTSRGWRERVVEVDDEDGDHHFRLALARCETPASRYFTAVHPLSAPEGVPDDDPSLAVWSRLPGSPPARLDGLERELGVDAEAAGGGGRTPDHVQALRAGRDGLSSLERAMRSSGGAGVRPGRSAATPPQVEAEAEAAALGERLQQLQRLEARMRADAAAAGVDLAGEEASDRAEGAARASRALRAAADRFEHVLKVGHRDAAKRAASAPAGPQAAAPPAGDAAADAGVMGVLGRLSPVRPKVSAGAPSAAPGSRAQTLDAVANAALTAHREAAERGALQALAVEAVRGKRTLGDLEEGLRGGEQGAGGGGETAAGTASAKRQGWLDAAEVGQVVEFSPASSVLASELSERVGGQGGAALIIDYGNDYAPSATVRGIKQHEFISFLEEPGDVDVTADVDFRGLRHAVDCGSPNTAWVGPIGQGEFLQRLGIRERTEAALATLPEEAEDAHPTGPNDTAVAENAELSPRQRLIAAVRRLVHPDGMGTVYKAMAIIPKALVGTDAPGVVGFPTKEELAAADKQRGPGITNPEPSARL